jgi:hypothetical protein
LTFDKSSPNVLSNVEGTMPPSTHLFERPMDMPIPASNRSLALPIKNRRPRLLPGPVISVLLLSAVAGYSQCRSGDPNGRFDGSATSAQAGKLNVSLNLSCVSGHYAGTLDTPTGLYTVTRGSFAEDRLSLQFTLAGSVVTVEARVAGNSLTGTFMTADDKGPVQLERTGEALPIAAAGSSPVSLTPQQWREDLVYLIRELPKRHPDPFASTSRTAFEAAAADLNARIDRLNSDEIYIGFDHLANLIGDAHTYVKFPDDNANLPLDIRRFGDDLRVVAVAPGYEQALGARVVSIQDTPIARAQQLAATIAPVAETDSLKESRIEGFLTTGMALHGLDITADRGLTRYTLATDDGKQLMVDFRALSPGEEPKWIHPAAQWPISEQPVDGSGKCTWLGSAATLSCNVHKILDLGSISREIRDDLRRDHPDKVVIDLRQNIGGDFNLGLKYLIGPLRKDKEINRKGRLFVLIGVNTFSAAMSNAAQFRTMTSALLVGQPIGERPNSYQEPRQFTLPNSRLVVRYSSRYYKFVDGPDNVVEPDKVIVPTWEDYKNGRDPVLEWALEFRN